MLGGTVLGGGRGSVIGAIAGALVLEALFMLLNLYGVDRALEQAFTGLVIVGRRRRWRRSACEEAEGCET